MALAPGAWLNHYEILSHLGTGGMGEVYRARDNKLQRDVALKVLPQAFAQDPERLARFRREAQVLAQVNHVNIAAIHSVEESDGTHFLVMELAEGETLRDRVKRGPLPLDESLEIVKQIAAGLEAAHEKPIVHRDLKPANVKVTPDGVVKILDFGLARAFAGDTMSSDPSDSPTLTGMTAPGTILGTAAYMSPEQARGKKVDKRTDIWALGCVLFELLAGKHAFDGEDVPEILASVMKGDPDWSALPASTPPNVRFALRRCLEKDPKRRFHAATDVAIALEEPWSVPAVEAPAPPAGPSPPVWRRAVPWAAVFLAGAIAATLAFWSFNPSSEAPPAAHVELTMPPGDQLLTRGYGVGLAVSPDGTQVAYVAIRNGVQQLFLRALDSGEVTPLAGTEGAGSPFFSPDGEWVGFFAEGKLKKVPSAGGAPVILCDSGSPGGATWGTDDTIIFAPSFSSGLWRVSADGGTPEVLTTLDHSQGEIGHRWPQLLPGGNAVLYTVLAGLGFDEFHTAVLRLDTGERRIVLRGGNTARYAPTGHLVYYRAGALLAVPFDLARLEVISNSPVTIADGITRSSNLGGEFSLSVSGGGSLSYFPASPRQFEQRLVWVDRNGKVETLSAPPRFYQDANLSPNGRQLAVTIASGTQELWIYDLARGTLTRFASEGSSAFPYWTPDGTRIAYRSTKGGFRNLFWKAADGSGAEEQLTTGENSHFTGPFSPDGKWLAFWEQTPDTGFDIWVLPLEGERKPQVFLRTASNEVGPRFSPDGRWLAYSSDESGRPEIYVQPFPGPGRRVQVSIDGGDWPIWARNGRELFYQVGDRMMAVEIANSPSFNAGNPRLLFEGGFSANFGFDISLDDQRFLMSQPVELAPPATQIHVVLNWFEELKRRVPVP